VIDARGAELDREPNPRSGSELIAVHPQAETCRRSGDKDCPSLLSVEGMLRMRLAEDVDPARVRARRSQHRPGHQIYVRGPFCCVLRGHDMGTQQGGLGRELTSYLEGSHLIRNSQPIAALDLDRRRAELAQLGDPCREQPGQLIVAGCPCRCNRDADTTSVVGLAGHPRRELRSAVSRKNQMAVRIDETWDDRPSSNVDRSVRDGRPGCRPGPDDQLVLNDHGGVWLDAEQVRPGAVAGHQLSDSGDQGARHAAPS